MVIPVSSVDKFPNAGYLKVDEELMHYTAITANMSGPSQITAAEGYTLEGANHENVYNPTFTGYEVYFVGEGAQIDPNTYNGLCLACWSGPGQGFVSRVTGYDYVAPDQWQPSQTYTLPDTWLDHVGEPTHGVWVPSNMRRVFIETDPTGILGPGSVCSIYPAITLDERGWNGTAPTAHSLGTDRQCLPPGPHGLLRVPDLLDRSRDQRRRDGS